MRNLFHKFMPPHDEVKSHWVIRPLGSLLRHHNLWHLHRRSVAGGFAVGLFCGLVPGPFQMISAALTAIVFRVNLPVAVFTTFYTNPFTIVPLYVIAYEIGMWFTNGDGHSARPGIPELNWNDWTIVLWDWFMALGEPVLVGLPILAIILSFIGYFAVRIGWRLAVVWKWRVRKRRQKNPSNKAI